jgi:hypothetical protein
VGRYGLIGIGGILVAVGVVWTLQGVGYLAGSPMTGVTLWAIVGPVVGLIGIGLAGLGLRRT